MSKYDQYAALAVPKSNVLLAVLDVNNITMSANGTTSKVTVAGLLSAGASGLVGLAPSNDNTGATDTTNIQGLLNLTGIAILQYTPSGTPFYINQQIVMPSNSVLKGAGKGLTTIQAINSYAATQVSTNTGMNMITCNGSQSNVIIRDLTLNGNQANISTVPGYADGPESGPIGIWNGTKITIDSVEVINAIGYSIYTNGCTHTTIMHCRVLTGQGGSSWNQQDGIHVANWSYVWVLDNDVDTGTGTAGDDGIALQAYTNSNDAIVRGNTIRSAAHGVAVVFSGATSITNVTISDNDIWQTKNEAVIAYWDLSTVGTLTNCKIQGVTGNNIGTSSAGAYISIEIPFSVLTIDDCTFTALNNTTASGFYINNSANTATSNDLTVTDNNLGGLACPQGIWAGSTTAPISGINISGNTVDLSGAASGKNPVAVLLQASSNGTIGPNVLIGNGDASSSALELQGTCSNLTVAQHSVTGFHYGVQELTVSGSPNNIVYARDPFPGMAVPVTLVGAASTVGSVVATASASSPSFTSGTAKQVNTNYDVQLLIAIQTVAALAVAIGPTSSVTSAIMPSQSYALGLVSFLVPAGWYVKITGTIADLTITAVTC